jgi:hypothetical protein
MTATWIKQAHDARRSGRIALSRIATVSAAAMTLAACGGGGGGATEAVTSTPQTETPANVETSTGPSPVLGADSFMFEPDASLAVEGAIDEVAGGDALFTGWNPHNAPEMMRPGMKVVFFGAATGCSAGTQGTATSVTDDRLSQLASLSSVSASAAGPKLRWSPSGNVEGCDASVKDAIAPSGVFLNANDAAGAVGLLTSSGRQSDGSVPFFGPFTAAGQDGNGTNKFITGSFVNFRQAWWAADPLQPWVGSAAARVRSEQTVGLASAPGASGVGAQVKQQMMATFLNPTCLGEGKGNACQMQYMLNTNMVQNGVSDWSQVSWFQRGSVWFDSVQGGMPIVEGPILGSGGITTDDTSGLELFRSQGSATQHGTFSNRTFDITISFDALQSVMRITTGRKFGVAAAAVTDGQIATLWGSRWNDRNAWVLLAADVAQEVYNPDSNYKVEIAGGFKSLFVGPQ